MKIYVGALCIGYIVMLNLKYITATNVTGMAASKQSIVFTNGTWMYNGTEGRVSPYKEIHIPSSFILSPALLRDQRLKMTQSVRNRKRKLKMDLVQSLLEQVAFDDEGEIIPGQKICLPLVSEKTVTKLKLARLPGNRRDFPELNPNLYIVRAMRQILKGDFRKRMGRGMDDVIIPHPTRVWNIDYCHENNSYVDLGSDFDLDDHSFTLTALIRLRPSDNNSKSNRGARIISKRDTDNYGWEFVVPSYYGQTISFYANESPGHIDYGKSSIPDNKWTVVSIVFDRHQYGDSIAVITPYIDGMPDGKGTYMQVVGNLSSNAPMTVGHARDEKGRFSNGRRDFRLPGNPRFNPHFQGDIKDIYIWHQALDKRQMRRHAAKLLRDIGRRPNPCAWGYEELDCKCYRLFEDLRTYRDASRICALEGGFLAMPKSARIQDFLEILMQQSDLTTFWIGLDDLDYERRKVWADGTVCKYDHGEDYNCFPRNRPDKQYHTEDCVEESKGDPEFKWNDENCIKMNPYICEIPNTKEACENAKESMTS
ncbi:uncharacterized protein LOC100184082 [Ciona intestinalis]